MYSVGLQGDPKRNIVLLLSKAHMVSGLGFRVREEVVKLMVPSGVS